MKGERSFLTDRQWTEFRNDSGEEIPAFGCIRITGKAVPEAGRIVRTAAKPNTYGAQYNHAFNGPLKCPIGNYGMCVMGQEMAAVYDSADGTPSFGEKWGPQSGTWKLKKNTGGFLVIGTTNETTFLALVVPDPFLDFRGVADASIAVDTGGTVSIWYRTGATTFADSGVNVTALNDLDGAVPSGGVVRCRYDPYGSTESWTIYQSDCP